MTERGKLKYQMARMNWPKILNAAIEGRRTSWGDEPVREWRNAGDEVFMAVINAMEQANIIPNSRKELKAFARKNKL